MEPSGSKGAESVKDRLMRLQRQNFRSIPLNETPVEKEQTVEKEIEELKQDSMIKAIAVSNLEDSKDEDGFLELEVPRPSELKEQSEVKERLDALSRQETPVPKPLDAVQPEQKESTVSSMLRDNSATLDRIKVALQKVEEIKKKMKQTDNFLGLYYDLNKAEDALVDVLNEVKSSGVEIPSTLDMRIKALNSRKLRD